MFRYLFSLLLLTFTLKYTIAQVCCSQPGWSDAIEITIDNTAGSALTNHQMRFIIDTQTLIAANKMKPDGSDIFVIDDDCSTTLNFWIEKGINTATTEIWILVPSIAAGTTKTIYLFHGNPNATALSAFGGVFTNPMIIGSPTASLSGIQTADWFEIQAGATVTLLQGQKLTINARKALISGTINGDGMGYAPGVGPAVSMPISDPAGGKGGSGGAYGGAGGSGGKGSPPAYGTTNGPDIDMGSGSGGSDCPADAAGGGAVEIYAHVLEVTAPINVNGQAGSPCCCGGNSESRGGGAGGGILLKGDIVSGNAALQANGGQGGNSSSKEAGGGGAGGRIKIFYSIANNFTGTNSVKGAQPGTGGQSGPTAGQDGTFAAIPFTSTEPTSSQAPFQPSLIADFTFTSGCAGTPAQFTDASTVTGGNITKRTWTIENQTYATTNPSHTFSLAGTYTVTLDVEDSNGCTSSASKQVTVNEIPTASFVAPDVCFGLPAVFTDYSTISTGSIKTWLWQFGDLNTFVGQNTTHTYATANTYNVTLTVTSDNNCSHAVTKQININDNPIADFMVNNVCQNQPAAFSDMSSVNAPHIINSWKWDFGNTVQSAKQNPTEVYTASGKYTVDLTVKTDKGCEASAQKQIEVFPLPIVAFSSDITEGCPPLCVNFTDNSSDPDGIASITWDFGNGQQASTSPVEYCYENSGKFDVTLSATSTNQCVKSQKLKEFIYVYDQPIAGFSVFPETKSIFTPDFEFMDESIGADSYEWDFGDGNTDNVSFPTHTYQDTGVYLVTQIVTSVDNCKDTTYNEVKISPEFTIFIPTAFTPNGDLYNDTFNIKGSGILKDNYEFLIFDRDGGTVFKSNDLNDGWDGGGKSGYPVGIYSYKVSLRDVYKKRKTYTGHVTLVR